MKKKNTQKRQLILGVILFICLSVALTVALWLINKPTKTVSEASESISFSHETAISQIQGNVVNLDGSALTQYSQPTQVAWIGTGRSSANSVFGLRFDNLLIEPNAPLTKATLKLYPQKNNNKSVKVSLKVVDTLSMPSFSSSISQLSKLTLLESGQELVLTDPWQVTQPVELDVTEALRPFFTKYPNATSVAVVFQGKSSANSKRFISLKNEELPSLTLEFFSPIQAVIGDCNGDSKVDAGDLSAIVLEIDDGDGLLAGNAQQGTFIGKKTCDANQDQVITTADVACMNKIIFESNNNCQDLIDYGDCNSDGKVDAGDLSAITLEISDEDGDQATDAIGGSFVGGLACDANHDGVISQLDQKCTSDIIFGNRTCINP